MRVLSAEEMQACDRTTTERFGISSLDLMRNASGAVARFAREHFPNAKYVTVLCGRGNNGGDGSMTARILADAGLDVRVILLGSPTDLKGDAAGAWNELQQSPRCQLNVVEKPEELVRLEESLQTDLLIDAIVGTGFMPPLRGLPLAALQWAKKCQAPILAVDLPSGWPADSTKAHTQNEVFPVDAVITFTAPKPAHLFGELTRRWNQPVVVAPIGSPEEAVASELELSWAGSAQALYRTARKTDVNKGTFGHVLVVGGTFGSGGGKAGAPAMASLAAMRSGAGLVTAAVPEPALAVVAGFAPELMTQPLKANAAGEVAAENINSIDKLTEKITVLAVGPGLGENEESAKFFFALLAQTNMPVVIDADGLNLLIKNMVALKEATNRRTVVLTPHPGEMARLAGLSTKEVQTDRLRVARQFAQQHGVHLVLKGTRTLIAHPSGHVAVNTTGNPGMAKGGSGDLLTGVIAGMLAQFPKDPERAVEAGVFLHGLAADMAVQQEDEHTLLATDSLKYFARAFRFDSWSDSGYVWLQGQPAVAASSGEGRR